MNALEEAVVEWLEGERKGQQRWAMLAELDRLSRQTKLWPIAPMEDWEKAVESCLKQGLITESNGRLRIAPTEAKPADAKQLNLF